VLGASRLPTKPTASGCERGREPRETRESSGWIEIAARAVTPMVEKLVDEVVAGTVDRRDPPVAEVVERAEQEDTPPRP